jgi:hypothetical protein
MNYGPKTVTNGLVLCLDAADKNSYPGSGTTWRDISGNNNTGTFTNGPTFSTDNLGTVLLDGTNDYVNVPYNVSLNPSSDLSFMIWTKLTVSDSSIRNPIELSAASDELYFILWRADLSPKRWGFGIRQSNNTYAETTSTNTNFSINTWYNIGLIANSSTGLVSLYINGVVDGSIAYNGTLKQNASATLAIGSDAANSRRYWQGNVSNVQIYNRALTATEMRQNYNATKGRFGL